MNAEAAAVKLARLGEIQAELADMKERRPALLDERRVLQQELRADLAGLLGRARKGT